MKAFLTNQVGEDDDDNEGYFQACASDVVFGRAQPGNDCRQFYCICKGADDDDADDGGNDDDTIEQNADWDKDNEYGEDKDDHGANHDSNDRKAKITGSSTVVAHSFLMTLVIPEQL